MSEIQSFMLSNGLTLRDFDAYICNSGSDMYYSSSNSEDSLPVMVDPDYHSHIEYRWGGEGLRKTLLRWSASVTEKNGEKEEQLIDVDEEISTEFCYTFRVQNPEKVPPAQEVRKLMRIQGLRCHAVYCQNGTKLNVIPVLASRSQALRYLYVRWGIDLSKTVVFVGECGDTDYEGLLGGIHKTVILKGVCQDVLSLLHANRSYPLSHVVPFDSPSVLEVAEDDSEIRDALEMAGWL